MKTLIIISAIVLCLSCKNDVKQTLQKEFLKSDWITSDSLHFTMEDSLLFINFGDNIYYNGISFKYYTSNDTLIIKPFFINHLDKFKILELSQNKLIIQYIFDRNENIFHFKRDRNYVFNKYETHRNNKTIKSLEFTAGHGMSTYPTLNLRIESDSSLVYRSGHPFTKHNGLYNYKLSKKELTRINNMFNHINLNNIHLSHSAPDANYFNLYVCTTSNEKFECSGILENNTSQDLIYFFYYLSNLEKGLRLNKIGSIDDKDTILKVGKFRCDRYN